MSYYNTLAFINKIFSQNHYPYRLYHKYLTLKLQTKHRKILLVKDKLIVKSVEGRAMFIASDT